MELNEIKSMWQAYDSKLEKSLKLNLHCLELIQVQKVKSKLAPLFLHRIIELSFHALAIILLAAFLYNNLSQFAYAASAIVLIGFYVVLFVNCLKQIYIIRQMDYGNDIVSIQSSLVMLQTNLLNHARLAVVGIPTLLAYPVVVSKAIKDLNLQAYVNFDIIAQSNGNWWTAQLFASMVLIPMGIWFYREVSYKNIHKQWVKHVIQIYTGTRVAKAFEFLKELDSLKHDVI